MGDAVPVCDGDSDCDRDGLRKISLPGGCGGRTGHGGAGAGDFAPSVYFFSGEDLSGSDLLSDLVSDLLSVLEESDLESDLDSDLESDFAPSVESDLPPRP